MPEYQDAIQFRSASDAGGGSRGVAAVCAEDQRVYKPSKANEATFAAAVDGVAAVSMELLRSLETNAAPRNREEEAAKARARNAERFPA